MSKSYKKNPFGGFTSSSSEKSDKKQFHKKYRRVFNKALREFDIEEQESIEIDENEVSNPFNWSKDGKQYFGNCKDKDWYSKELRK
jgi:hypothetical protein